MKNNINAVIPKVSNNIPHTKIPIRSVRSGGNTTPTASKAISRSRQIGSNSNYLPKLAMTSKEIYGPMVTQDAYKKRDLTNYYKSTIQDINDMKNADRTKMLAKVLATSGLVGASYGAAIKNTSMKNYGYLVAGLSGLLHGVASGVRDTSENQMMERNKLIMKGFKKQAAIISPLVHIPMGAMTGGASLAGNLAIAGADLALLPALAHFGKGQLQQGISSGLKKGLGYPLSKEIPKFKGIPTSLMSEHTKGGFVDVVNGLSDSFISGFSRMGKKLFGTKGENIARSSSEYLSHIPKGMVGASGYEIADKVLPAFNLANQIDPAMTKRIIDAIPNTAEGEAARKSLSYIGKHYEKNLKDIGDAFNNTKVIKKVFSAKPGSKEQFMANLKAFYDGHLTMNKASKTKKTIVDAIGDLDRAAIKAKNYAKKNERLINTIGFIAGKGSKKKSFVNNIADAIKDQKTEEFVDNAIKGLDAGKAGLKALGVASGVGAGAYGTGYVGTRVADKVSKDKETREKVNRLLKKRTR